jgi:hypothetical protein
MQFDPCVHFYGNGKKLEENVKKMLKGHQISS